MRGHSFFGRIALVAVGTTLVGLPASAQESHVLLVVGLGGQEEYREAFHRWATSIRDSSIELGVDPSNIMYLGERPEDHPGEMDGKSTREELEQAFSEMSRRAGGEDRILVVLIGHGTSQGEEVRFNLPGRDVSGEDVATLLEFAFPTQMVALVNTAPASGPFVEAISGPRRVVLTATRTARERNETRFGEYFAASLVGDGSDLDKDGRLSLLEVFEYTRSEVARFYEDQNLILTEHALLDDNGDGEGSSEPGSEASLAAGSGAGDGRLARRFWIGDARRVAADAVVVSGIPEGITDPELLLLYEERVALETQVAELRARKDEMEVEAYETELENILVDLALKTREIRAKAGGAP